MAWRFPFLRVGLLLVVGSVFASVMMFWVSVGAAAADLERDTDLTRAFERREALWPYFRDNVLFAGAVPGWLFWIGVATILLGVARNFGLLGRRGE